MLWNGPQLWNGPSLIDFLDPPLVASPHVRARVNKQMVNLYSDASYYPEVGGAVFHIKLFSPALPPAQGYVRWLV